MGLLFSLGTHFGLDLEWHWLWCQYLCYQLRISNWMALVLSVFTYYCCLWGVCKCHGGEFCVEFGLCLLVFV